MLENDLSNLLAIVAIGAVVILAIVLMIAVSRVKSTSEEPDVTKIGEQLIHQNKVLKEERDFYRDQLNFVITERSKLQKELNESKFELAKLGADKYETTLEGSCTIKA